MFTALLVAASLSGTLQIEKDPWAATTGLASATAIDSAVWTGWMPVDSRRSIVLEITYTWNAGTAVTMVCESANPTLPANDAGFEVHQLSDSATVGTSTSVQHTWSNAVGASEKWTWTVSNLPHDYINCAITATGGNANDKAAVRYRGVSP